MPDSSNMTPVSPSLVGRVAQGIRYVVTGIGPGDWFGPAQPMAPMAQDQALGRVLDYRVGYNLSLRPREDEAITYHQLRALADACSVLRLVIETRKDQMERLTWGIQPRLAYGIKRASPGDLRIALAENFFARPDGHNGWGTWLRQILEELLVTDAVALYRRRDAAGRLFALQQIDGATIKRVIDESGLTPIAPDPAYQQILHGLPAVDYTADQLLFLPRNKRIHKLYGFSPVEQVVMIVNIALRRQAAQLNYFTEGNIPEALISCPQDWRPNQIREMQEIFDDMLRGNLAQRSGAKFVPGGLSVQFTKDALLKDDFDEWLTRIICYAFSVPPTPFVKQTNRATADNASDTALQEGLAPLQSWVKALIDRILAEDFAAPDLEFVWNQDAALSPADAMTINTGYVAAGLKTRNEVRADLGLGPVPGGDVALVTTGTGLAPIVPPPAPVGKDWHFDPSQPRDERGRWTVDGGGSGGGDDSGDDDSGDGSDDAGADDGSADDAGDSGDDSSDDSSDDADDSSGDLVGAIIDGLFGGSDESDGQDETDSFDVDDNNTENRNPKDTPTVASRTTNESRTTGSAWTEADEIADPSNGSLASLIDSGSTITETQTYGDQVSDDNFVRSNIVQNALKNVGSEAWSQDVPNPPYNEGDNKCNLFVSQILAASGADPGTPNPGNFGGPFPPTANQWADPSFSIPGWYVLGPNDTPVPGDVVAQHLKYDDNATGHVMIVGPNGTVIGTGPDETIEIVPMPDKLGPKPLGPIVYRRWKSKG